MNSVAVIGAGTMGRGIAIATATSGYTTTLYDISDPLLENAQRIIEASIDKGVALGKTKAEMADKAKRSLQYTTSLKQTSQVSLVIEAVPESLTLKQDIFCQLDLDAPDHTILASNTSSLSITSLASVTKRPDRFIGLHFFNPAHIMKLVEVIFSDDTSQQTLGIIDEFVSTLGKSAVHCKDTPAFIVNRVARPFYGEALRLLGENASNAGTIDRLMKSIGFRMGPFELIDLVGSDVNLAVTKTVYEAYFHDPKYRPHPIQRRMVETGRLGRKTGRGFYKYDTDSGESAT
jgi:3-hydroxybutyryl-CoA dehydrogenase